MKKTIALFFLLLYATTAAIHSQQTESLEMSQNTVFNAAGLTYDSIMATLSDKNIAFDAKFEMVRDMEDQSSNDKKEKAILVYKRILIDAKKEIDKHYIIDLYCVLANSYISENKLDIAKCYLDSAFVYEEKTDNLSSLALMNYIMSRYYLTLGEEDKGHEYLFRTISYFEKTQGKESTAILLLYNLSEAYYDHNDVDGLKKILDKMIPLANKDKSSLSYIHTYTVVTAYNQILYNKEQNARYLDTIMEYNKKTIDIYEKAQPVDRNMAIPLIIQHYLNTADIMSSAPNPDWTKIIEYIHIASEMEEGIKMYLGSIDNRITLYRLRSRVLLYQQKYNEALIEAKKSLEILEIEASQNKLFLYTPLYSLLAEIYEKKEDYRAALKYTKLKNDVESKINEARKYDVIKDLQIKYGTAEKDLKISQLNEERQRILYNRTLMIGGLVFLAILLTVALLYNRAKRYKKEKEALGLSIRINEKEAQYQTLLKESKIKQMRHYLDGLEAERDRLAKNLHDNVANRLFIFDHELRKLNNVPTDVSQQIEELYTEVRNISHELISPVFQYTTLSEILHNHIQDLNEGTNINFDLNISDEAVLENISADMSHEIYRIIQECTGNIMKYSSAKNAKILLVYNENRIELLIEDDGIGFDPQSKSKGIGIQIIKDRCRTLGGSLHIASEKGKGCKIKVQIPFSQSIAGELQ